MSSLRSILVMLSITKCFGTDGAQCDDWQLVLLLDFSKSSFQITEDSPVGSL
jgi:hypothetical protein